MNTYWLRKYKKRFDTQRLLDRNYLVIDHLKKRSFQVDLCRLLTSRYPFYLHMPPNSIVWYLLREYIVPAGRAKNYEEKMNDRRRIKEYRKACLEVGVQPRCNNHNEDSIN